MITVDAPTVEFGGTTLFKDISFQINPKDRVVAYLPQHLVTQDKRTVFDETCQAFAHLHEIQAEIDRINNQLTTRTDYESPGYTLLIEKLSALSDHMDVVWLFVWCIRNSNTTGKVYKLDVTTGLFF